jgi:transposase
MIIIGVDSHKQTDTAVAVDGVGRRLAERTVRANSDGHLQLVDWARSLLGDLDRAVSFAVEDCRHLIRRLEADLVPVALAAVAAGADRAPHLSVTSGRLTSV